ncbi:hypothetical protein OL548_14120 [Lysinibacillus sp. MHQ-1]|nr:hypothetical protein OL548_14120 [Lysinibacillus sp. MHQ-1]
MKSKFEKTDHTLQSFSNNIRDGTTAVGGLLTKIKEIAGKYLDFQVVGRVLLSNENNTTSGLNLINNGLQTTEQPLTQAMGSGNLQGQDLNNAFQSTSNGVQNTTNYLNALIEKIREIASSGKISMAEIRKAVLGLAFEGIFDGIVKSDLFKELVQNAAIAMEKLSSIVSSTLSFFYTRWKFKR